jgi:molybdopterin converting factor small subunit
VKFLGAFRGLSGKNHSNIILKDRTNVKALIQKIAETFPSDFKRSLIDPELNDPRPNALILVNGKEVSALEGIATKINDGDEVVLISVSHGG